MSVLEFCEGLGGKNGAALLGSFGEWSWAEVAGGGGGGVGKVLAAVVEKGGGRWSWWHCDEFLSC